MADLPSAELLQKIRDQYETTHPPFVGHLLALVDELAAALEQVMASHAIMNVDAVVAAEMRATALLARVRGKEAQRGESE